MKQVFISHDTDSDGQFANRLANELERLELEVWIAPRSIRPGEEWLDAIGRGLEMSSHFALVSTPSAYQSKWVHKEYNAALLLEADGDIEVLPLEVETTKIPLFLRGFQLISFINKFEAGLRQLASALGAADKIDASLSRRLEEELSEPGTDFPRGDMPVSSPIPDSVSAKEPNVFVAYDVRDKEYAHLFSRRLESHGIKKWMAPDSIEPGARWGVAIVDAIVDSTAIVVIMTPRSASSQAVQQEVLVAEREGIRVFPILLAGEPFDSLSHYQYFDARNGEMPPERFIEKLKG